MSYPVERGERDGSAARAWTRGRGLALGRVLALSLALSALDVRADDEPTAEPGPAPPAVAAPRPAGRRPEAREVWVVQAGAARQEWIVDGLPDATRERFRELLTLRGARLVRAEAWPEPAATPAPGGPADPDVIELLRGQGHLPPGYVPHGERAPEPLPALAFLGGTVVLELVEGATRARLLSVPEGSQARKMGLREGDAVLALDAGPVDPQSLAGFPGPRGPGGIQRWLTVRRTHGGIERIVLASWGR